MELIPPALATALVSGLVAFFIAHMQVRVKLREIENFHTELSTRLENYRQMQLLEILKLRAKVYPELWRIVLEHTVNWPYRREIRDENWALEFLEEIDKWNATNGLFFSEYSYSKFKKFRKLLFEITRSLSAEDATVAGADYEDLYRLFIGDRSSQTTGLATALKNDLGSYLDAAIQANYEDPIASTQRT